MGGVEYSLGLNVAHDPTFLGVPTGSAGFYSGRIGSTDRLVRFGMGHRLALSGLPQRALALARF